MTMKNKSSITEMARWRLKKPQVMERQIYDNDEQLADDDVMEHQNVQSVEREV